MNQPRQHVGVSGFELRQLAVFDDFLRQFVHQREFFQHVGGGGARLGAAAARRLQRQAIEENFRELLRRIDVEFESGDAVDAFFELADFLERFCGDALELDRVHANAGGFHARENGRERQINLLVKFESP